MGMKLVGDTDCASENIEALLYQEIQKTYSDGFILCTQWEIGGIYTVGIIPNGMKDFVYLQFRQLDGSNRIHGGAIGMVDPITMRRAIG